MQIPSGSTDGTWRCVCVLKMQY